jgi:hypothetical protein
LLTYKYRPDKEKNAPSRSSQLRDFGFLGKFNDKARSKLEKFFQGFQEVDALVKHIKKVDKSCGKGKERRHSRAR